MADVQIPIDLYRLIFENVQKHDLTVLAKVSKNFQLEAEAILYSHVDLFDPQLSLNKLISWCRAVTSVQRRAHFVDFLKFPTSVPETLPEDPPNLLDEFNGLVTQAFNVMVNLKHLFIMGFESQHPHTIHASTLEQVSFRLKSLAGGSSGLSHGEMWNFISNQSDIEYWVPTQHLLEATPIFPDNVLPRICQAVIGKVESTVSLAGRPIKALALLSREPQFDITFGMRVITPLKSFAKTLHTVFLTHGDLQDWSAVDMIRCLSENIPGLVSLTLWSFAAYASTTQAQDQKELVEACSRLRKITTLVLNTYMLILPSPTGNESQDLGHSLDTDETWDTYSLNPGHCRQIANEFFVACPQLSELSFPFNKPPFTTNDAGHLTYVRSHEEPFLAIFEGFHAVDTSGWWIR